MFVEAAKGVGRKRSAVPAAVAVGAAVGAYAKHIGRVGVQTRHNRIRCRAGQRGRSSGAAHRIVFNLITINGARTYRPREHGTARSHILNINADNAGAQRGITHGKLVIASCTRPCVERGRSVGGEGSMCGRIDHQNVARRTGNANLKLVEVRGVAGTIHQTHPVAVFQQLDLVVHQVAFVAVLTRCEVLHNQDAVGCRAYKFVFHIRARGLKRVVHTESGDERQVVIVRIRQGHERAYPIIGTSHRSQPETTVGVA